MKKILDITGLILAVACVSLAWRISTLRQDRKRLQSNQTALLGQVEQYRTEAGNYAASVQALELTKSELERSRADLADQVASLNVKLKRVQALSQTMTETHVTTIIPIRDTIIIRDTAAIRLSAVKWRDPWVNITGIIQPDSTVDLQLHSVDTLMQVVHRVPRRFLFFRWGCKAIRQEVTSTNPHTDIVYTEYIQLSK